MTDIFLKIVNMSISACWIVLAILLLRLVLKKAPKWINCVLWGIAGLRLVMPFSFESVFSLVPSVETITKAPDSPRPQINSGVSVIDNQINGYLQGNYFEGVTRPVGNFADISTIFTIIWIIGIVALLIYTLISFIRLKSKIETAVLLRDNIYQSEAVISPFVLGIIKPKIYLPFNMDNQDMEHVIAHEQAHICRKDHLWKPLGFLILTLHWFNPMVWIGYILLCRDIELACDEKVVKELNNEQRADYSQALLTCSVNRRMIAACPLAFGEVGVKDRIKSVLNYKKPAFWIIVVAIIVSIVTAVCFLTNPLNKGFGIEPESNVVIYEIEKHYYDKVVGADIANESNGYYDIAITKDMVLYKYFKTQGGTIDNSWFDIGKLVKQEDTDIIEALIKDNIPIKYKLLGIKEFYVALDESEIQSASCVIIMKNGDVLFAEIPAYKTENRYVSNLMKLKIKKSEIQNGTYKLSNEIYFNGAYSYIPNFENDKIEIKTEGGMHIYHFIGEELSTGALYEEVNPNKENFSNLFSDIPEWFNYESLDDLLKNNKKAWYHNTPDDIGGYPYMLLLQKDGTLYMAFADFENGEPTRIRYVYGLEYTGNAENGFNNEDKLSIEELKEKYPQFFNVSTDGGLTVYVWQTAENDFRCYLANTSIEALTDNSFAYETGSTIAEMRTILTTYNVKKEDITIHPVKNPLYSYPYTVDAEYRAKIKELFWADIPGIEDTNNSEDDIQKFRWIYRPMLSYTGHSFYPFKFDLDYTHIIASCENGFMQNLEADGQPKGSTLQFSKGQHIYWTPEEAVIERIPQKTEIILKVYNGKTELYQCSAVFECISSDAASAEFRISLKVADGLTAVYDDGIKIVRKLSISDIGSADAPLNITATIDGYPFFIAEILKIYDNSVLVKASNDTKSINSGTEYLVSTNTQNNEIPVPDFETGMKIAVIYDGEISETNPAGINSREKPRKKPSTLKRLRTS